MKHLGHIMSFIVCALTSINMEMKSQELILSLYPKNEIEKKDLAPVTVKRPKCSQILAMSVLK